MAFEPVTQCRESLPRPVDVEVAELARAQGGVVTRAQLVALGVQVRTIGRRVQAARLHVVHRGVYAVGHEVLGRAGREWAAALATGGVLSHRSAGARLGVLTWNGRPEVTAARGRKPIPGVTLHTTRSLHPDDSVLEADGLRHTSWARTTVDLADLYDLHRMTRYLERSAIERRYDGITLTAAMERARGRHGLPTLVAALNQGHHLDPQRTRSGQEEDYLEALRAQGAGDARFNHWMWVHDRFIEADVWFPDRKLIVELDSRWHDTAGARQRDAARDQACRRAGIEVRRLRASAPARPARASP